MIFLYIFSHPFAQFLFVLPHRRIFPFMESTTVRSVIRIMAKRQRELIELQRGDRFFKEIRTSWKRLRRNFTFHRAMKVNLQNCCHAVAVVAILTLYGREHEKYWRFDRAARLAENKHRRQAAISRYLIVSHRSVSRRQVIACFKPRLPFEYVLLIGQRNGLIELVTIWKSLRC